MAKEKKEHECSCGKKYPKWQGKCDSCGSWNTLEEKVVPQKMYRLPKVSLKRKEENKKPDIDKDVLDKWFNARIAEAKQQPYCENCGASILYQLNSSNVAIRRSVIAHILPKRKVGGFPSVATHPSNRWFACGVGSLNLCHDRYDSSWDKAIKMPIWGKVISRFEVFKNEVKESTTKLPLDFQT